MPNKKKTKSTSNVKRRRTSTNKQIKQRRSHPDVIATITARDGSVGKRLTRPTTSNNKNIRKSGKVITNNTSSKSFRRGTVKRLEKRLPMTSWLLKPLMVTYYKIKSLT